MSSHYDRRDRSDRDRDNTHRDRGGDRDRDRDGRSNTKDQHQDRDRDRSSRATTNESTSRHHDHHRRQHRRDDRSASPKRKSENGYRHHKSRHNDNDDDKKRRTKDKKSQRHRRSDSESSSGSESDSGSGSSEEDELVKKAKSLITPISKDDYFLKATEFRTWLRSSKRKYFEDLSSEEARKYFGKFVKAWNNLELDDSMYKGIRTSQVSSRGSTKYQWGFAKKMKDEDLDRIDSTRGSIDTMTNIRFAPEVSRLTGKATVSGTTSSSASTSSRPLGPMMPPPPITAKSHGDRIAEREEEAQRRRLANRADQRDYRKTKETVMEELVPKATGREAILEKRRAQTAYHRRERSPDVELPESDLMGTGDDFKSRLQAEKRRKEAIEERKTQNTSQGAPVLSAKLQAHKEKEEKQLEAFRQMWAQTQAKKGMQ